MHVGSLAVAGLVLALASGCGGTSVGKSHDTGSAGTGTAMGEGGTKSSPSGGSGGLGVSVGGTSAGETAGAGGGPMLPPDGEIPPAVALHKLDLLLMIDNSRNMGQKQQLLKDAVSWLLGPGGPALSADDIHVGVITSSLGAHGAMGAKDVCASPEDDDHAHLLGQLRPGLTTFKNSGFLAWGPTGDPDIGSVLTELAPMIDAAGETGCGYEASLEAWYRFLIDPEPPAAVVVPQGSASAAVQGVDALVLSQRAAFLRPDSVLAVVMLSDENDCSIQDEGYGWLITRAAPIFRSTSACQQNPNGKCCQSCGEVTANAGCPAITSDSECSRGSTLASADDDLNLRCWDQKRRFGFSLLYPVSRYRDGLTRQTVIQRSTQQAVANPIFVGAKRHPSQVILTGIVGVPWQDLADKASLTGPGLTNLTAAQLTQQGRWEMIVGDPDAALPKAPSDPFMVETPNDRSSALTKHPLIDASPVAATSTDPRANAINGHESVNLGNRELQTVCIFPRAKPIVCDQAVNDSGKGCLCFMEANSYNRAACQPLAGGATGITQYFEQAYPGARHLQLLQQLGNNAVTASACPKVTTPDAADYGYRPAMKALAARLEAAFNP